MLGAASSTAVTGAAGARRVERPAADGTGSSCAAVLAREGARVFVVDADLQRAERTCGGIARSLDEDGGGRGSAVAFECDACECCMRAAGGSAGWTFW